MYKRIPNIVFWLVLAMVFVMGLIIGYARADAATPAQQEAMVERLLPKISYAWPNSGCAGHEKFVYSEAAVRAEYPKDPDVIAFAGGGTSCTITFGAGMPDDDEGFCNVLVHELGHLAGYDHDDVVADTNNPLSTMDASAETHWVGCNPSFDVKLKFAMHTWFPNTKWSCRYTKSGATCKIRLKHRYVRTVRVLRNGDVVDYGKRKQR